MKIALIGDFSADVTAHRAIPEALQLEAKAQSIDIAFDWIGTETLRDASVLSAYHGGWVVPASPYASFDNALASIRYLRENDIPFLGTCGGYQHALVEFARNVLGHERAGISEVDPDCPMPIVSALTCALIEETSTVLPETGSLLACLSGGSSMQETYRCSFGINPDYASIFENSAFQVAARDPDGTICAMWLDQHPFFFGCAFQPERAALTGRRHSIVTGFVNAALRQV